MSQQILNSGLIMIIDKDLANEFSNKDKSKYRFYDRER